MSRVASVGAFVATAAGELHVMSFRPAEAAASAAVLIVPPFAEEMNRARRMLALQARACAALGFEVLLPDLYGTGDSDGEFRDATWEGWRDGLMWLHESLGERGQRPVVTLGVRTGALLASEVAARSTGGAPRHVFWQPVTDGSRFLDQFLRLRVAAAIVSSDAARETVAGLRARLASGETLEVAGYELSAALAGALAGRSLAAALGAQPARVEWFEIGAGDAIAPGSEALGARLNAAGHTLAQHAITGPQFWSTLETAVAEALIAPTARAVATLVHEQEP